jgi:hypothetical protein
VPPVSADTTSTVASPSKVSTALPAPSAAIAAASTVAVR